MKKRYTCKNPDGSFRVPVENVGDFRINQNGISIALFGDLINKLGEYEEAIEEARKYAQKGL